jgi:hypothetical protein
MSEATPAPAAHPAPAPAAPSSDAGKTLGIVGLVLAFVFALAGLIVSIIARSQSKNAGVKNTPATVGLVLSIIFLVIQIIWVVFAIIAAVTLGAAAAELCAGLEAGEYITDTGVTVTCG